MTPPAYTERAHRTLVADSATIEKLVNLARVRRVYQGSVSMPINPTALGKVTITGTGEDVAALIEACGGHDKVYQVDATDAPRLVS
jgi:hypothetical protein